MVFGLTYNQIIAIVVVLLVVIFSLKIIKGIIKWLVILGVVCIGLVYFGIVSPKQIKNVSSQIENHGIETYQKIAETSENIRIKDDKIQVKVDTDKWININKLESIIKDSSKELIVKFDGKTYTITDKKVRDLIESFR